MQNSTGGWASYERRRGPMALESINPSEVFGDIMVDVDYPECTTSVSRCLSLYSGINLRTGHYSAFSFPKALSILPRK